MEDIELIKILVLQLLLLPLYGVGIILLHETGHLICGWMSGYRMLSLRVGSLVIVATDGGLKVRKLPYPFSTGQCLMYPASGKAPEFMFYGGIIVNYITAIVAVIIAGSNEKAIRYSLYLFSILNMIMAILNGRNQGTNDGRSARTVHTVTARQYYFWQLRIIRNLIQGIPYREMEAELFQLPEDLELTNPYFSEQYLYRYYYCLDTGNLDDAKKCLSRLRLFEHHLDTWLKEEIEKEMKFINSVHRKESFLLKKNPVSAWDVRFYLPEVRRNVLAKYEKNYVYPGETDSVKHIISTYMK